MSISNNSNFSKSNIGSVHQYTGKYLYDCSHDNKHSKFKLNKQKPEKRIAHSLQQRLKQANDIRCAKERFATQQLEQYVQQQWHEQQVSLQQQHNDKLNPKNYGLFHGNKSRGEVHMGNGLHTGEAGPHGVGNSSEKMEKINNENKSFYIRSNAEKELERRSQEYRAELNHQNDKNDINREAKAFGLIREANNIDTSDKFNKMYEDGNVLFSKDEDDHKDDEDDNADDECLSICELCEGEGGIHPFKLGSGGVMICCTSCYKWLLFQKRSKLRKKRKNRIFETSSNCNSGGNGNGNRMFLSDTKYPRQCVFNTCKPLSMASFGYNYTSDNNNNSNINGINDTVQSQWNGNRARAIQYKQRRITFRDINGHDYGESFGHNLNGFVTGNSFDDRNYYYISPNKNNFVRTKSRKRRITFHTIRKQ